MNVPKSFRQKGTMFFVKCDKKTMNAEKTRNDSCDARG